MLQQLETIGSNVRAMLLDGLHEASRRATEELDETAAAITQVCRT